MADYSRNPHQRQASASHGAPNPVNVIKKTALPPSDPLAQYQGPVNERKVPTVPPPARNKPTEAEFFKNDERGERKPNPKFLKDHFFNEGRLKEEQALYILNLATRILAKEPNMVEVKSPVTVCGDIHGQYYDLMKLFEVGGSLQDNVYLFLGDYVDRGDFGIECLLYLYSLKIWSPTRIVLLRGNHECRHLTEYFTFKKECLHKYSEKVYEACIQSFCALPVAAIVDNRFFCVHGGISPSLITLNDLATMNRFQEPGSQGLLCDLLWADPITNYGHETEPSQSGPALAQGTSFIPNATRGCSYFYTYNAVCQFLERNSLLSVIRGHEAQDAGYTMHRKTPKKNFPSVITIFSAPNYLDVYKNRGAVLKYANKNITIRQYNSSSHPYWLPNFMDAFTWSLPFVGAKIADMLLAVLSVCSEEELDTDSEDEAKEAQAAEEIRLRRQQIKNKIRAVGRMQRVFALLREEAENATELTTDVNVPTEALSATGVDQLSVHRLSKNIRSFADARKIDIANERLPEFSPEGQGTHSDIFPAPSMRIAGREGAASKDLIMQTLREELDGTAPNMDDLVERVAERLSGKGGNAASSASRPAALKRHGTT
ncbi:serine/threonine-protein phosphatase 2B catalytic subunit [Coprinopsis marcescibilis]|uniref:Serine/threonine-protein phosphatase n=1 Tax=Coprinopsis marcescibilis TaxID=230819 RepID=A0A5C3KMD8_COPMA|nr:serine/threonine-protein phosphatase 2B catalytic subunit [Coprinopsis marcescibilis]